jgi:hypothetical protein
MAKWNSRCSRDDNSLPGAHPAPAAAVTAPFSPTFNHLPIRPPQSPYLFRAPMPKYQTTPVPFPNTSPPPTASDRPAGRCSARLRTSHNPAATVWNWTPDAPRPSMS